MTQELIRPSNKICSRVVKFGSRCQSDQASEGKSRMSRFEHAAACFEEGFSCAQAVVSTYGPLLGLDRELGLRIAGAFGAGMARMGKTCGAVTGGLMVIGLQSGKTEAQDEEARERCYDLAREFVRRFEARNGSTLCRELLGYDIGIPAERARARDDGLFDTLCPRLVGDAAEIVESILATTLGAEGAGWTNRDPRQGHVAPRRDESVCS